MGQTRIPLVTVIGRSRSGKTTLIEQLIRELRGRGYRIGTIKHHSHPGFDFDVAGKDSWRFAQAGSDFVVIASPDKLASYRNLESELSLDEITSEIRGVDIILVEGYRNSGKPTIEIARAANSQELIGSSAQWIALVTDFPIDVAIPQFGLDDTEGVANLLIQRFLALTNRETDPRQRPTDGG